MINLRRKSAKMEEEEEKEEDSQHDSNLFRPNELLHGYKRPTLAYLII